MAPPSELCPRRRGRVVWSHPGASWAPVRLWTRVPRSVLEASARSPCHRGDARSEKREAFVTRFPGQAGVPAPCPSSPPHPARQTSVLAEAAHACSISQPVISIYRLFWGQPMSTWGPGWERWPWISPSAWVGVVGGRHSAPTSPGRSLLTDTQNSATLPWARARDKGTTRGPRTGWAAAWLSPRERLRNAACLGQKHRASRGHGRARLKP